MLRLNNIEVKYMGVILVLKGVSFEVPDGTVIALLGANGGGKTTTLKAISGLLHVEEGEVTEGSIEWNGSRIDKVSPEKIVQGGIVQVVEGRKVCIHLSVEENLRAGAHLRNDRSGVKHDLGLMYDYFPVLKKLKHRTSGLLSGGEQQMLVMARGLMAKPTLMLLDEPSLGLAPILVNEIFMIIERINKEQNVGILLVEQNAQMALEVAEYGYIMENGRVVLDGSAEKLRDNEDVKEFYLGLTDMGHKKSFRDIKHYKRRKRWLG